jgi:hypothetical protein
MYCEAGSVNKKGLVNKRGGQPNNRPLDKCTPTSALSTICSMLSPSWCLPTLTPVLALCTPSSASHSLDCFAFPFPSPLPSCPPCGTLHNKTHRLPPQNSQSHKHLHHRSTSVTRLNRISSTPLVNKTASNRPHPCYFTASL